MLTEGIGRVLQSQVVKLPDYVAELSFDQLLGGVFSAIPAHQLPPPDQRPLFADQLLAAVGPQDHFSEPVHVAILIGHNA